MTAPAEKTIARLLKFLPHSDKTGREAAGVIIKLLEERAELVERCAKIADEISNEQEADYTFGNAQFGDGWSQAAERIASAIRNLKVEG